MAATDSLLQLAEEIISCRRCPRLREWCAEVARAKRRAYQEWDYWGKPVPSFGDAGARLLIIGLAPAAHGANRTGRIFTGDRSGDLLFKVLHATGFASQPTSTSREDGLRLKDAYITAAVHCAPPDNKPSREELARCAPYLAREWKLLGRLRVVVALGRIAFETYCKLLRQEGRLAGRERLEFGHNRRHDLGAGTPVLISSYHPSQQNTSTGRLTEEMFLAVFRQARQILEEGGQRPSGREHR